MKISLQDAGKRFNREWIFRHLNYQFETSGTYAITGSNGSGKSTLLQVIAGATMQSEGSIEYQVNGKFAEDQYKYISIATPYLEVVEELTAMELLDFHKRFKPFTLEPKYMLKQVSLDLAASKQIRYFSSGMKQRLKLAIAFFSNCPVLLLDEPTTNLDKEGIVLYHRLVREYTNDRLVIVCSNDEQEFDFCEHFINMRDYK